MEEDYQVGAMCSKCKELCAERQNCSNAGSRRRISASIGAPKKDNLFFVTYRTRRKFSLIFFNFFQHRSRLLPNYAKLLQFFLFYFVINTASALPKLCSEPAPIDLLAHAISRSDGLPIGVEVASDANNVKGYRFDPSARLLGVDSDEIFPLCHRFPAEFSILFTFQHRVRRKTDEYLMTLLAQNRKSVLIALRFHRNRLFFDYFPEDSRETKVSSSIKSSAIYDGKWHTVVVTVTSNYITFTLDCETTKKRKMKPGFPKKLNIRKTKIYIGSRRKKSLRFTGLLRQLILLPGADATNRVCPSNNPSLATLDDSYSSTSPKPTLGVIFENELETQTCSIQSKGTLKYTQENTLEICTGEYFNPVKGGPDRMDYVVDFEDVVTDNFTVSIEKFTIPGEGLFLATANNHYKSHIFKWDGKKFVKYQGFKTKSAMMWKFFVIDYSYFLAVANSGGNENGSSVIYRWHPKRKRFLNHQRLRTFGVRSLEFFTIDDSSFLFVADHQRTGIPAYTQDPSVIYRWNPDRCEFQFHQEISTRAALDVTFFQISLNPKLVFNCLVVANSFNGESSRVLSEIYCWEFFEKNQRFQKVQAIETVGAADWEFFQFQNRYFLAVANSFDYVSGEKPNRTLYSNIYELNIQFRQFVWYQEIETQGANDWEFFQIGNQYFLLVSNTASNTSEIYRWRGIEKFVKVHSLPVGPCSDFDYIEIDGEHYLAYANPNNVLSKLYKIITY